MMLPRREEIPNITPDLESSCAESSCATDDTAPNVENVSATSDKEKYREIIAEV